jgi:TM2 domain-containing membrane protein YozV
MNCLNHPDVAAAAYCQTCGKPLCTGCMRSVGGVVYCEPCLTARLSPPAAGTSYPTPGSAAWHPHPVLAGLLGFIPGVGAMYNGQYVKALAHVLIFAVFVSLSDHSSIFGLFVAAWVFYQVFDAAQTAIARRDGTPLPNPFGLNDLASRLGMPPTPPVAPYVGGYTAPGPAAAAPPGSTTGPAPGSAQYSYPPAYPASYAVPPDPAAPGMPAADLPGLSFEPRGHKHPVGAIVLIVIGVVLLLQTMGVLEDEWISRAWPLLIVGVGAWLLYRRTRETPRGGSQ